VLFHNHCAHSVHNGVCALYLLHRRSVHIDFKVGHQLDKIRVRRQFAQQSIVHLPAFQQVNHSVTQTQVCKISVWVTLHFRQPQQIVGGHAVKLRQLDKSIVADVLKIVRFITAQRRLGEVRLLCKLFQRQATLHTQVFQAFLNG